MRDLTSRLREIVRRDHGGGAPAPPVRELTYVPDTDGLAVSVGRAAETLGGVPLDGEAACLVVDRVWEPHESHGRRAVEHYAIVPDSPLALFDATAAGSDASWAKRVVFFDLETTGLSGGAGTLPFLAGCGWFEDGAFRVRQFFLTGPAGERAMLDALAKIFDEATLLVSFNGRSFDVPLMEMRWAFHRGEAATDGLRHFDMLHSARRLWGRRGLREHAELAEPSSCTLSALERQVIGFHRIGDVPGFEIPTRYFHYLRTGEAAVIAGVLEHNRHDLLSTAAVMSHALWLAREGPDACREGTELMGLGRLYERAGETDRALLSFERAASGDDRDVRPHALARLATLLSRLSRHDAAASAWQSLLDDGRRRRGPLSPLTRRATEALAIHHEHRARDFDAAKRYAEQLETHADDRTRRDAAHRLGRLNRKISAKGSLLS
jgi:uncharacterized protein YprB with RNaseH-like and TPR domain